MLGRTWLEVLDILSDFLDDTGRFMAQNHRRFEYKPPDGPVRPVVHVRATDAHRVHPQQHLASTLPYSCPDMRLHSASSEGDLVRGRLGHILLLQADVLGLVEDGREVVLDRVARRGKGTWGAMVMSTLSVP